MYLGFIYKGENNFLVPKENDLSTQGYSKVIVKV